MNIRASDRRTLLKGSMASACIALIPIRVSASPQSMREAMSQVFGDTPITPGRLKLSIPELAENGASVKLVVDVQTPTDDPARLVSIHVFSEKNPLPDVGRFFFSPEFTRGPLSTRIRLNDSQTIMAVATFSDGSLWSDAAKSVVTLAACVDSI